jgi:hypothetical protein
MVTGLEVPPAITSLRRTLMKFFQRQNLEKDQPQVELERSLQHEPEGHVHPNYRHWVYLRRSSK